MTPENRLIDRILNKSDFSITERKIWDNHLYHFKLSSKHSPDIQPIPCTATLTNSPHGALLSINTRTQLTYNIKLTDLDYKEQLNRSLTKIILETTVR
jgi:hypothetical protein